MKDITKRTRWRLRALNLFAWVVLTLVGLGTVSALLVVCVVVLRTLLRLLTATL